MNKEKKKRLEETLEGKSVEEQILSALIRLNIKLEDLKAIEIKRQETKKVEVLNFPPYPESPIPPKPQPFPDKIKIEKPDWYKEPKETKVEIPQFPKEIEITKPNWWNIGKHFDNLIKAIKDRLEVVMPEHEEPKRAIAVKLIGKNGRILDEFDLRPVVYGGGGGGIDPVGLKNIAGSQINPAKEDGNLAKALGLSGTGTDTTFTLTVANTAYAIPASPPTDYYTLLIYNASDTDVYFRFTTGITAGVKIATAASLSVDLGPNQQVYVYCGLAGKVINLSYKII